MQLTRKASQQVSRIFSSQKRYNMAIYSNVAIRIIEVGTDVDVNGFLPKSSVELDHGLDLMGFMKPMGYQAEYKAKFPEEWKKYENWLVKERNAVNHTNNPLPHPDLK